MNGSLGIEAKPADGIERLKERIDASKRIVFFGGAGVSTESGIPDFRSESGLYNAKRKYGRSPEEMISHSFFMRDTDTFYAYYKENMLYPEAKPNAAHLGIAALETLGKDVRVVTQNIDGLHQAAGSSAVYELHGSVHRNVCMSCGARFGLSYILDPRNCVAGAGRGLDGAGAPRSASGPEATSHVPYCERCGGIVKPDVVLYEEGLDDATVKGATGAIAAADLLIVGGTSLVVYPAAGFIRLFGGGKENIALINLGETSADAMAGIVIRRPIGEVFAELASILEA